MRDNGSSDVPPLNLRVQITVDIGAEDFLQAADHQRMAEAFLATLRQTYPQAALSFRHLRTRGAPAARPVRRTRRSTGALSLYRDA